MGCTASKLSVSHAQVDIATGNNKNNNRNYDDNFHIGRLVNTSTGRDYVFLSYRNVEK